MADGYRELAGKVIAENETTLMRVDPAEVDALIERIVAARRIQLFSMGRCQLAARGFAMRLAHMGHEAHIVYDTVTPAIGPGDLLIGLCFANNVELNVAREAKKAGASIALITPHPESEHGKLADLCVRLPGQIFGGPDEVPSIQPMATLLEQSLLLFTDIVVMMLIDREHIPVKAMHERHGNLEGLPKAFA